MRPQNPEDIRRHAEVPEECLNCLNCPGRTSRRSLSRAPNSFAQQSLAQTAAVSRSKSAHQGALAEPLAIGTDGSQTGIAKFRGNLTAISAPSGQGLVLSREPDCSLSLFTGTISLGSTWTYTSTGLFADYDRVLHTNAGLTTTPGAFSSGCVSSTTGFGSRRGVYAGHTTTGVQVFAAIGFNAMLGANALVIGSGITSFTWTTLSFSVGGAVTAADLNRDGNGDLVVNGVGTTTTAQVFVLLGNPDGTFQTAVPYTVPGAASLSAVIDDINGDGKLDIVASSDNGQISILTGKGDVSFNSAQSFAAPAPVYPGSTGTPSTSLTNLITADLRGTHKKGIIASNGLVLLNDGAGNFTAAPSAAFPPISSNSNVGLNLATGDFNNDGKLDLVVSTGGTVFTYTGKGDGTFTPSSAYTTVNTNDFVTVSDLDGDGNADIYIGEANGGFYFGDDINLSYALMGNGDGTFSGAPAIPGSYIGANLGDVNGDGQPDLITPTSGTVNGLPAVFTVQLGTPKGSFTPASTITLPATIVVAGFNGPTTLSTAGAGASSFAVGDLNGDGKADLTFVINGVTTAPASGLPTIFPSPVYFIALSNGDGTFTTPVATTFPQIAPASGFDISLSVGSLNIGDFTHDGHNDLVFTFNEVAGSSSPVPAPYNQGFAVLPGVGNGTFQSPILTTNYNSDTAPTFAALNTLVSTTDINKDGNNDLLAVTHTGTPSTGFGTHLQLFLSRGDGTFNPSNIATAPNPGLNGGVPCALGDLNGDNKVDLVCTGETTSSQAQFSVSLGNGDGTFAPPTISNLTGGDTIRSSGVAIADFDGDGKPDLALINPSDVSGLFYGKGDGTFTSVVSNSTVYPKDLLNLSVGTTTGGAAIALDLNKDGKPDILSGNTLLLNLYASAPTIVPQANTTTTLQASATSIPQGSSLTLTATVAPATGSTIPSGSILFADGETVLGSATVDATGKATFSTTALTAGSHNLTSGFAGSTTFLGSVSSTIAITVSPAAAGIATTTTLTASATTAVSGATLTFTATVTPASGTAIPTGTITFSDGATSLGTGTLDATGKATLTTSTLALGSHSITAAYGGATTPTAFSNSTSSAASVSITSPPIVTTTTALTASATAASSGTNLIFTAVITPASGTAIPTGTVTFSDGSTTLGTGTLDATGKATYSTSSLAVGSHTITAAYGGAATFSSSTCSGLTVTITAAGVADFTITVAPTTATVALGASTTATITITPVGGFKQQVLITATGQPANTSLTFNNAVILNPDGVNPVTLSITLLAANPTASLSRSLHNFTYAAITPLGILTSAAFFCFGLRRKRRWTLQLSVAIAIAGSLAIPGCGGGGDSAPAANHNPPSPGVYTLTFTGTAMGGSPAHSATYTVTIH
jgi:hypothetical protein